MAKIGRKRGTMTVAATISTLDQLDQIYELNRFFLIYLQARARDKLDLCGLPPAAMGLLLGVSPEALHQVADFPHALFNLKLDAHGEALDRDERASRYDGARTALYLSALLCARTVSRRSVYQAQLLLGLDQRSIQQLKSSSLGDLQRLALRDGVLQCAFPQRERLWLNLLTETRGDARQRLAMVALQPGGEREWPQRRGAHPAPQQSSSLRG
jgi:hypothetical protein